MQESMSRFQYKSELTADGSPTLRLPPTWEPMHSLDGAFTETLYIYQPTVRLAIQRAFETTTEPRILSVGLGIGYNEILIACESMIKNRTPIYIDSYESVSTLRVLFCQWVRGETTELNSVYNLILDFFSKEYNFPSQMIVDHLKRSLDSSLHKIHSEINSQTVFQKSHGILFDAFSDKSTPELWTDDFLNSFFTFAAAEVCYLSTYASKGTLHRALKLHGFISEKKPGFAKKRESTFAKKP